MVTFSVLGAPSAITSAVKYPTAKTAVIDGLATGIDPQPAAGEALVSDADGGMLILPLGLHDTHKRRERGQIGDEMICCP